MLLIFSLVSGLAIALTFQLLFANLGIALGLSLLNFSPTPVSSAEQTAKSSTENADTTSDDSHTLPITHLLGAGVLLSATSTIFIAALISTEFSTLYDLRRGIIFSLLVWSVYWLLFTWLSTTTITSVAESVFGTAIAGGKELLSLVKRTGSLAANTEEDSESAALETMRSEILGELSQMSEAQEALPTLLADHREQLVKEISDRTQLSSTQIETILTGMQPQTTPEVATEPPTQPESQSLSTTSSSAGLLSNIGAAAKSKAISVARSQIDIPGWQEISQKVINNVDISDLEALWQKSVSFLEDTSEEDSPKENAIKQVSQTELSKADNSESSPETNSTNRLTYAPTQPLRQVEEKTLSIKTAPKQLSPAAKAFQKKLIAYCRYTNPTALTSENLSEKIATLKEEKKIKDLSSLQIDIDAIATIITNRKTLSDIKKQSLIETLTNQISLTPESKQAIAPDTPEPDPNNQHESPLSQTLTQTKQRIAHYLHAQDKATLQPKQIAHDLTRIVGSSLQTIPHPSQLPARSHLDSLLDTSSWQQALEKRKDMTLDEAQEVLSWMEAGWEPMTHQASKWITALQSEASQLLEKPEEAIEQTIEDVQQQIVERVEIIKEKAEEQAIALKQELQTQADTARAQTAIAAWWLFGSLLLSSVAASGAGWLAVRY